MWPKITARRRGTVDRRVGVHRKIPLLLFLIVAFSTFLVILTYKGYQLRLFIEKIDHVSAAGDARVDDFFAQHEQYDDNVRVAVNGAMRVPPSDGPEDDDDVDGDDLHSRSGDVEKKIEDAARGDAVDTRVMFDDEEYERNDIGESINEEFPRRNHDDGAPPAGLIVRGKRDTYTPVPAKCRKKFYSIGKGRSTITPAFEAAGWKRVKKLKYAQIYMTQKGTGSKVFEDIKPWQRYSRVPGTISWDKKDRFLDGFIDYHEKNPDHELYFLPETYRLKKKLDRLAFSSRLDNGGMEEAWVLKQVNVNNGRGIEILAPGSIALKTAISRAYADDEHGYIAQSYVCNELTWTNGAKFDLRFFWLVASTDPPIVMYHDGYVRVGGASHNETDFSDTHKHLTNHKYRSEEVQKEGKVLAKHLYQRIRQHYEANKKHLSKLIHIDPAQHVINQMKESIATLYAAHIDNFPSKLKRRTENIFGLYGMDFIIDNNLSVFFIEAQSSPGIGKYQYHKTAFREIFRPVPYIIEEIQMKQETNPRGNILPLKRLGGYEVVYAGDWQYKYEGYRRTAVKTVCGSAKGEGDVAPDGAFVITPSHLQYRVVHRGTAGGSAPRPGQGVSAHYTGWLDGFDGKSKFDSSRDRDTLFTFNVGKGQVIRGWDESFSSMIVGERRQIIVPPELGYGSVGAGSVIPGGATLYFDVELIKLN